MAILPNILKGAGAFAFVSGLADALFGAYVLPNLAGGEVFVVKSLVDTVADSQIRFLGSAWAGWGAMLWWASNDVNARRTPLAILGGAFFLGGIGRTLSILIHEKPTPIFIFMIVVEFLGPVGVWLALREQSDLSRKGK